MRTGTLTGTGTSIAANGDQMFWIMTDTKVTFTGGTGRFENLTGGFEYIRSNLATTFPDPNTLVRTFTYDGVGTVTY